MEDTNFVNLFCFFIIFVSIKLSYPELVVNVKTRNGQYTQQHLMADPEKDIVIIDFTMPDGTKTTTLIDFSKSLQVLKTTVLGEMERGEKPIHTLCFVLKFLPNEFISSDAMSKLRQKNPAAIRIPEEELKTEFLVMEKEIPLENSGMFSGHVHQMCGNADKIYTSGENIEAISQGCQTLLKMCPLDTKHEATTNVFCDSFLKTEVIIREQDNEVVLDNYCLSAHFFAHTELGIEGSCLLSSRNRFMSRCS